MSRNENRTRVERLLRLADELEVQDPNLDELLKAATVTSSQSLTEDALQIFAVKAAEQQIYPFPEDGHPASIQLGTTPQQRPVGISPDDLTKHLLAVGQSGAGKTTFFYNLMCQLEVPFWSFDLKQDYRHLIHEWDDLLCCRGRS
ncbi:hypothetical protein [Halosolutus halophilus]|uniref:hypothetical protein n=1 Tax=Halosolutus halophilus TaxID=1552990 RepID=UPI0022350802|nr:hypothetical protein [Halosolutus halophilus]